jgi:hypothetical protein
MGLALSTTPLQQDAASALVLLVHSRDSFIAVSFLDFFRDPSAFRNNRLVVIEPRPAVYANLTSSSISGFPSPTALLDIRETFDFKQVKIKDFRLWVHVPVPSDYSAFTRCLRDLRPADFHPREVVPASLLLETQATTVCEALQRITAPVVLHVVTSGVEVAIAPPINDCDLIVPRVYVGSQFAWSSISTIGVTHIVTLTNEIFPSTELPHFIVKITDSAFQELTSQFWAAVDFITLAVKQQGTVLIHCRGGASRSPALCIAYMMLTLGYSFDGAICIITKRRPSIAINPGFIEQLRRMEHQIQP